MYVCGRGKGGVGGERGRAGKQRGIDARRVIKSEIKIEIKIKIRVDSTRPRIT